jgi:hypothetical protein
MCPRSPRRATGRTAPIGGASISAGTKVEPMTCTRVRGPTPTSVIFRPARESIAAIAGGVCDSSVTSSDENPAFAVTFVVFMTTTPSCTPGPRT